MHGMQRRRRIVADQQRRKVQEPALGKVPSVQRNRCRKLTDRLECPECNGTGEHTIGPLRMVCTFCQGAGYVGGDNEPAEEREAPPGPVRPVWEHPAVRTLSVCKMCLGTRKVVNLGGTGEPTGRLIEMPCPACSTEDEEPPGNL